MGVKVGVTAMLCDDEFSAEFVVAVKRMRRSSSSASRFHARV
jgi:hypothetical protein